MKNQRRIGTLFAALSVIALHGEMLAQDASAQIDATTTISLSSDQSVAVTSIGRTSDRVNVRPNQTVNVSMQFSAARAGDQVVIQTLDGGNVGNAGDVPTVAADNSLQFTFQASADPGLNRIIVRDGNQEIGLQIWVVDPNSGN
jgi:hypothetical protein